MNTLKKSIKNLPNSPGIYKFYDEKSKLLYVGKSKSIRKRVASYFGTNDLGPKTSLLVSKIDKIQYIKVFSEFEALLLESQLIRKHKPFFNIISKDDKSPLYVKVTSSDYPLITVARKSNLQKREFTKGPFPSAKITYQILKTTRKVFPYCSHQNPRKPCLYVHLGLCPYPYKNQNAKQEYKKTIVKIKKLLSGNIKGLTKDLKKEMQLSSKVLNFEKANAIKNQIEKLEYLTSNFYEPVDFIERPTLVDDLSNQRLQSLKLTLQMQKIPKRIECYDISNIQGKQATGSMVVFENGQAQKSEYRKFKIKFINTPDDYEMIRQVLQRRLKNAWKLPDLIVIDGGKGQLKVAASVIANQNFKIPVISLAKKHEEIYTTNNSLPVRLPKSNQAGLLLQSLRDEAHHFAIKYHRLLRSNDMVGRSTS